MEEIKLKTCPFCNSPAQIGKRPEGFVVGCIECLATTWICFDEETAVKMWNTRIESCTESQEKDSKDCND